MKVLIRKYYRTGVQTVEEEDGKYYVTLKNRTQDTRIEVDREVAMRYLARMRAE